MKDIQCDELKKITTIYHPTKEDKEFHSLFLYSINFIYTITYKYYFPFLKIKVRRHPEEQDVINFLNDVIICNQAFRKNKYEKIPKDKRMPHFLRCMANDCRDILEIIDTIRNNKNNHKMVLFCATQIVYKILDLTRIILYHSNDTIEINKVCYDLRMHKIKTKRKQGGLTKGKNTIPFKEEMYKQQKEWFISKKSKGVTPFAKDFARIYYKKCLIEHTENPDKYFPFGFTAGADMEDDNAFAYLYKLSQKNNQILKKETY